MEERLLIVFPHPDDEAYGAAGMITQARQKGTPVTYACVTLGEMGRNMGRPLFANRETLPQIRKKELLDLANVLDIQDLRMLGLRDKTLEFLDIDVFADKIEEIINDVKPTHILTHYPGFAVHPDHNATGAATIQAVKRMPKEKRPVVWCHAFSKDRIEHIGEPDVIFDVTAMKDKKIEALKAHRSQTEGMMNAIDFDRLSDYPQMERLLTREEFWTYNWE
ncbi:MULTISPECIES: bacillithiol biosynthesis deacetylase BshB2 [Priestia]|jgi:N-acetylglucosamine malate deacetylase 2|uniref:Bacillithiol biosynthesis deacetylase BshB2 n=7 Tax=Priestia TaxID=2800373 RepID=D5DQA6_PRIM1|nr:MULTISPECIES: bacillithiol biosynthesis deacetylase BshB2 [Priestia]AVX08061.1 bacillithiol biosynthesis deacetylase BshB2 [Bacillus sp. Y-01]KOP74234.1 deacetylase [Bacillus sp. FJAT-21351]KQU25676.1 bacillithiol biosynthesis deacetylase BshB2 [Bacillus sp. Leaf75]KRD91631.1 bacillithiol biosynthesis deacetylase BshB2 [Bacillus sp. Root147]KRE01886.1 bacillithiol biosynthesis deacetylase BshB2 [Bacillus sp. Root239]KRF55516.1 bacillithiol biosynthesis deacetylase BshB2 [Bacillus sp. Soil5